MAIEIDADLQDEIIHHTLTLFRLSATQVTAVLKRLRKLENKLKSELNSVDLSEIRKAEINALLKAASDMIVEFYTEIPNDLNVEAVSRAVVKATTKSLTVALGEVAIEMPTDAYFKSLASNVLIEGSPAKDWWAKQSENLAFKFAQQVRQGLANNETNQEIISRVIGKNGMPGIMNTARRNAASLVQTSVQAVANDARLETFRANADIVNGLQQISTLDSHTTDICIAYAGATWDLDGNPLNGSPDFNGGPPRHFNCRSVLVPITKSFEELGLKNVPEPKATTRASEDGQTAAQTTFTDFLGRKSATYQDEMLGAGRAQMWRDGKITLRDLVNGQGRPLTLAELQRRFH